MSFYPMYILFKKEMKGALLSFFTPLLLIVTLLVSSLILLANNYWLMAGISDLKNYFASLPWLFSILLPLLSMNVWADERKDGTYALLASMPISERDIVASKYATNLLVWFFMWIASLVPPLSIARLIYISPIPFLYSVLATFVFGSCVLSISQAISFASKHSALNFFFSFIIIVILNLLHIFASVFYEWAEVQNFLLYLSFYHHFDRASKGILDSRDIVYYFLLLVFCIELNIFILRVKKK